MGSDTAPGRVQEHVAAFNAAVRSGDWESFADRFAPDASMAFIGVPGGSGTMQLDWQGPLVTGLQVAFDD
jgi:hypothetical protein